MTAWAGRMVRSASARPALVPSTHLDRQITRVGRQSVSTIVRPDSANLFSTLGEQFLFTADFYSRVAAVILGPLPPSAIVATHVTRSVAFV